MIWELTQITISVCLIIITGVYFADVFAKHKK